MSGGKTYTIPEHVWRECICIIRDYDRVKTEYELLCPMSPTPPDGQPRSRSVQSPTEREALKLELMSKRLDAVDEAFKVVPAVYSRPIRENIVRRVPYPDYVGRRTFVRWKARLIKSLAEKLFFI